MEIVAPSNGVSVIYVMQVYVLTYPLVPRVSWTRLRANDVTAVRSGKPEWGSAFRLISQVAYSSVQGKFERLESSEKQCLLE